MQNYVCRNINILESLLRSKGKNMTCLKVNKNNSNIIDSWYLDCDKSFYSWGTLSLKKKAMLQ